MSTPSEGCLRQVIGDAHTAAGGEIEYRVPMDADCGATSDRLFDLAAEIGQHINVGRVATRTLLVRADR